MEEIEIQRYPAYKVSGVEWVGEIPEHWKVKKLKFFGNIYAGLNGKKGDDFSKEFKQELRAYIPFTNICNNIKISEEQFHFVKVDKKEKQNKVLKNDILFLMSSETLEDIAKCSIYLGENDELYLNSFCKGVRLSSSDLNSKYFNYLFLSSSYRSYFSSVGRGFTRVNLKQEFINDAFSLIPPLDEQTAIANFLDHKTTLIHRAIQIKEKQIELLKERRQILIHKAVTRGLNSNVKMKNSGVEWIGEIPEGWEMLTKMKFISSLKGRQGWQGLKAEEYKDEGPHILSSAHFNNYIIDWHKCPRVSIERYLMDKHIQLNIGDILLMKDGANMGKLALVENLPGLACLNSHLLLFRSLSENGVAYYWPKFMFYHMMCREFQDYVKINGTGSTFLGISQESIGNYPICLPPIEEQRVITKFLDGQSSKFDQSISLKEQEIEKLKEYKATLINSAVTGKIKVS